MIARYCNELSPIIPVVLILPYATPTTRWSFWVMPFLALTLSNTSIVTFPMPQKVK